MNTQLYLTLCNPVDSRPPGSSAHEILQDRLLEWVAISSLRDLPDLGFEPVSPMSPALAGKPYTEPPGKSICIHMHVLSHFSCVQFFVTQCTVALQAPQSMGFSREEYWSGWPDPAGDLLDPGSTPGYTHIHTHTHIYTHTYTHTHTQ